MLRSGSRRGLLRRVQDQFLTLNGSIGGFDGDGLVRAERSVASRRGLWNAYRTGRVVTGEGLATMPIIDFRPYLETSGDIHDRFRSFSVRQRLLDANGPAENQVIWIAGDFTSWLALLPEALAAVDEWLTDLDVGTGRRSAEKVVAARPACLVDTCWDSAGTRIEEPATFTDPTTKCNQLYPNHVDPRVVAGEQVVTDTMKCRLARPKRDQYAVVTGD